eukprot:SAG11_NODE_452_length_9380_cov_10.655533_8_plen_332_part_00
MASLALVSTAEDGSLTISEEAAAMLSSIEEPVSVVVVAGPYRTGKSFLLNCLTENMAADAGAGTVFDVQGSVRACTMGMWLWPNPQVVRQLDGTSVRVLFIDSEGIGAPSGSGANDLRMFSLGVLLSSLFVFNTKGAIDEAAIKQLSFITKLAQAVRIRSDGENQPGDFEACFPQFLWVLRDFALSLTKDGKRLTANDYLEESLKPDPRISPEVMERNRVRFMLKEFFQERGAFTLPVRVCLRVVHRRWFLFEHLDVNAPGYDRPVISMGRMHIPIGMSRNLDLSGPTVKPSLHAGDGLLIRDFRGATAAACNDPLDVNLVSMQRLPDQLN